MKVKQISITRNTRMKNIATVLVFVAVLALGVSYLIWLDAGCETSGVMTWEGKKCFNDLAV